jgi:hypothetical protein
VDGQHGAARVTQIFIQIFSGTRKQICSSNRHGGSPRSSNIPCTVDFRATENCNDGLPALYLHVYVRLSGISSRSCKMEQRPEMYPFEQYSQPTIGTKTYGSYAID